MAQHDGQLRLQDFYDLDGLEIVHNQLHGKDIDAGEVLMPIVGAFADVSTLLSADVYVLGSFGRVNMSQNIAHEGPFATAGSDANGRRDGDAWIEDMFASDVLMKGVYAGKVAFLQAIPYGLLAGIDALTHANKNLKAMYSYAAIKSSPPPWHRKLFQLLEARVEAEGAAGPIFVLGSGKPYWDKRSFITAAALHGNYVARDKVHENCQACKLTTKYYPDRIAGEEGLPAPKTVAQLHKKIVPIPD